MSSNSRWFLNTQHSSNFKAEHEISCCSLKLKSSFMQMTHSADLKCRPLVTRRTSYAFPPACRGHNAECPLGAPLQPPAIHKWIESESERERATKTARDASLHEYMNRLSCETEQTKELVWIPASNTKQRRAPHSKSGHLPLNLLRALYCLIIAVMVTAIGCSWLWKLKGLEQ